MRAVYNITPVPAPRMTRSDAWKKRPCVMRYFDFRDQVKNLGITVPECGAHITFIMPMPASWSRKKKIIMNGAPHKQKPDSDNLMKALLDASFKQDAHIWDYRNTKIWGYHGKIIVQDNINDDELVYFLDGKIHRYKDNRRAGQIVTIYQEGDYFAPLSLPATQRFKTRTARTVTLQRLSDVLADAGDMRAETINQITAEITGGKHE